METVLSPKALEEVRYTTERRMQFCGTCGVGIGLMTEAEYADLYACSFCGGKLRPALEREERSLFSPEIREYVTPSFSLASFKKSSQREGKPEMATSREKPQQQTERLRIAFAKVEKRNRSATVPVKEE